MRESVGERPMAVGARLSADELTPGGMTIEDCIEAVLHLHEQGLLDFVSLVLGHSAFPSASTWIAPPPPTPAAAIALPAAAVRAAIPRSSPCWPRRASPTSTPPTGSSPTASPIWSA